MKNPFAKLLHHYIYNLKLKNKLIISHAILLMVPTAVVTGFLYARMYGIVIDDTIRSEQALAAQTVGSIESLVDNAIHAGEVMARTGLVLDLFNVPLEQAGTYRPERSRVDSLYRLATNLVDHSFITDIRIYYDDSLYQDLSSYNRNRRPLFLPISGMDSPWTERFEGSSQELMLCPGELLSDRELRESGGLASVMRLSYSRTGSNVTVPPEASAYVAVYFSPAVLESVLKGNSSVKDEATYIVNEQDIMVADSNPSQAARYFLPHRRLAELVGGGQTFSLVNFKQGAAYSAYFPIHETDWYMVSVLPANHIADSGTRLMIEFILVYLLFVLLAMFIALLLSSSIADRIIAVAYQMESVRTGRPKPMKVGKMGCDEIGVLSDTYNYMTSEINRLMDAREQAAEDLRKAEFRALQAQINPHFLYNTLDMINWLSQTGRKEDVTRAVQALSRFYKLTLSRRELMNTIGEELEHVSLYVQLQNMRYDNCATLVIDVPEELYGYTIPKLTFQPLVENALLHGIRMTEKKSGSILLTGWREGDDMVFIVSDDGAGIPPEKLDSLQEGTKKAEGTAPPAASGDSGHIGVYNTNLRLKSLYGSQYGLAFDSRPGIGTEVTVRLPARRALS